MASLAPNSVDDGVPPCFSETSTKHSTEARLRETLARYRHVNELHPTVNQLGLNPGFKESFQRALCHEFDTISSRSADLDDHEITIAQKAFLMLMQEEETHHGAVNIFVEELLGIRPGATSDAELKIQDAVHVRASLVTDDNHQNNDGTGASPVEGPQEGDAKLTRLEILCKKAKADLETSHASRFDRMNAAKFLRDTVENTISYIQSKVIAGPDQIDSHLKPLYEEKLTALEKIHKEAAQEAQEACFGKPRPFEKSLRKTELSRSSKHHGHAQKRIANEMRRSSQLPGKIADHKIQGFLRLKGMHGDRYRPA